MSGGGGDSITRGGDNISWGILSGGQYNLGYIVRGDTFSRGTLYPPTPEHLPTV